MLPQALPQGSPGRHIHSCEEKLHQDAPLGVVTAGEPKNEDEPGWGLREGKTAPLPLDGWRRKDFDSPLGQTRGQYWLLIQCSNSV